MANGFNSSSPERLKHASSGRTSGLFLLLNYFPATLDVPVILSNRNRTTFDIPQRSVSYYALADHLVFVTKYRLRVFDQDAIEKLRSYFASMCADFDVELVDIEGESDHVHVLVNCPQKLAVSSLVNSLKGVPSRLLRRDRPDIAAQYYYKGVCGYQATLPVVAAVRQHP